MNLLEAFSLPHSCQSWLGLLTADYHTSLSPVIPASWEVLKRIYIVRGILLRRKPWFKTDHTEKLENRRPRCAWFYGFLGFVLRLRQNKKELSGKVRYISNLCYPFNTNSYCCQHQQSYLSIYENIRRIYWDHRNSSSTRVDNYRKRGNERKLIQGKISLHIRKKYLHHENN